MVHGNKPYQKRRKFLKVTGAMAAGLAGCTGNSNDNDGTGSNGESGATTGTATTGTSGTSFPQNPITLVIPYGTGGGYDYYTRLVAKYINQEDYLPVEVQPQNVTGGGGIVGHNRIYNAEPNGYTNGIWYTEGMARAQIVREEAKFDMTKLTPYPVIAGTTPAILTTPESGIQSGSDYIKAVQNNEVTFSVSGVTGNGVIIPVAVGTVGGAYSVDNVINNYVVYDSKWTGVLQNEANAIAASYSSALKYVESGDIRPVLVLTTDDKPSMGPEDVDTLNDVDIDSPEKVIALAGGPYHRVFVGPPDIPEERAKIVREAIRKAIKNPDLQQEAEENDRPISYLNSQEAKKGLNQTLNTWKENEDLLQTLQDS